MDLLQFYYRHNIFDFRIYYYIYPGELSEFFLTLKRVLIKLWLLKSNTFIRLSWKAFHSPCTFKWELEVTKMFLNRRHIVRKKQVKHAKIGLRSPVQVDTVDTRILDSISWLFKCYILILISCLTGKRHLRKKPECDCDTETYHRSLTNVTTNRYCRIAVLPSRGTSMITRKKFS